MKFICDCGAEMQMREFYRDGERIILFIGLILKRRERDMWKKVDLEEGTRVVYV